MDALTFLKERSRMCDTHRGKGDGCKGCPLDKEVDDVCSVWCFRNPEKVIAIVEQWVNEHPRKTRQSEFLKHYPNARFSSGCLNACPRNIFDNTNIDCDKQPCYECKKAFWLVEVEDGSAH